MAERKRRPRKPKPDRAIERLLELAKRKRAGSDPVQGGRKRAPKRAVNRVTQRLLHIAPKGGKVGTIGGKAPRARWVQKLLDITAEKRAPRTRRLIIKPPQLRDVKSSKLVQELRDRGYNVTITRPTPTRPTVERVPEAPPRVVHVQRPTTATALTNRAIAQLHGISLRTLYRIAQRETQRHGKLVTIRDLHDAGYDLQKVAQGYRVRNMQIVRDATWRAPKAGRMRDGLTYRPLTLEELEDFEYLKRRYRDAYDRIIEAKDIDPWAIENGLDPEGVLEVIRTFRRSR